MERKFCCRACCRVESMGEKSTTWVKARRSAGVAYMVLVSLALGSGVVGAWEEEGRSRCQILLVAIKRVPLRMVLS